jgi:hypothetical protein
MNVFVEAPVYDFKYQIFNSTSGTVVKSVVKSYASIFRMEAYAFEKKQNKIKQTHEMETCTDS